jgi:membrane-associated phospholipid phosphatase
MGRFAKVGQTLVAVLIAADLWFVRLCVATARPALGRRLAVAFSRIGNGGLYPVLATLLILGWGARGRDAMIAAAINVGLVHSVYPAIKRRAGRRRPFQAHADLESLLETLDEHSFPSGHVMTLTAALVPIVLALPATLPLSLGAWCAMAWARLASAHHYPSDIFAGAVFALLVSYPLSKYGLGAAVPG